MAPVPNNLLRAARYAADLTQGQLAERANALFEAATGRGGAMDDNYIGKLERGLHRWPNHGYRAALRAVLEVTSDRDLGFASPRSRVAIVEEDPQHDGGGDDVDRKAFLRVLAGSVAGLAFTDPLGEFGTGATGAGRRIGQADVDHVRHLARLFACQDHQYGGHLSARAAVAQLSASAELAEGTFATASVRADLFSAVAELADTTAGVCFDAGLHVHAERAFRFGVGCATESGDWSMRAKALSGLANLSVHQGRSDDALSFAEMALVRADRLSPKVGAMVHTRHARALGLIGVHRADDCRAAVTKAEDLFGGATTSTEPAWLSHYGQAHLERDAGRALLHLALGGGDHHDARQRLESAIIRFPEGHSRGKALARANLAVLLMTRDDPREAVEVGDEALAAVGAVRSDRVDDALRQLAEAARRHPKMDDVRDLARRVERTLATTAGRKAAGPHPASSPVSSRRRSSSGLPSGAV
ncbi:helix-turn-helix domain-containing protein [Umezawaea sp. Da 62-37]|uniref:helix-turn-helix domain-containing protein n=1 Tax=Umezawaea sp. Da 62-37 TaxID=3075927 RepID=UPI0028F73289|nr:helix-turn-helix domain-containing protein [Umezawaea sp. Da 62-37]WNV88262.1 helix-turn-helix domain-containing protein [Umezawaea sp. Da 62-37]